MNCEHRDMDNDQCSDRIGPKCHRDAAYIYEWNGDEVGVCEMHSGDVREHGFDLVEVAS